MRAGQPGIGRNPHEIFDHSIRRRTCSRGGDRARRPAGRGQPPRARRGQQCHRRRARGHGRAPGAAGDYDGDGNVGVAEDTDNTTDRIFGTIGAALLAANGGANANGHVIIVGSGRFPEQIVIPNVAGGQAALNGVTILEAAPGVQANIDAVLQGDAGNATRQAGTGITINTQDTDRVVILRNIAVRNFQTGLQVTGNARVVCEDCRFDSNVAANVSVGGNAKLTLVDCEIRAGGMRFNPGKAIAEPGRRRGLHGLGERRDLRLQHQREYGGRRAQRLDGHDPDPRQQRLRQHAEPDRQDHQDGLAAAGPPSRGRPSASSQTRRRRQGRV